MKINRTFTDENKEIVSSVSTDLFKLIAVILIVKEFTKISLTKLQIYIWGVQDEDNAKALRHWREEGRITNAPWVAEDDIAPIVMTCIANNLLRSERNSNKVSVMLDYKADGFISRVKDLELSREIIDSLKSIGNLTDKQVNNLEFDF